MIHTRLKSSLAGAVFAALAIVLGSCAQDYFDGTEDSGGNGHVTLSFNPRSGGHAESRATYDEIYAQFASFFGGGNAPSDLFEDDGIHGAGFGRKADREISSFRVLIYDESGNLIKKGNQYWNFYFPCDFAGSDPTKRPPFNVDVVPGTYHFVFIANEQSLHAALSDEDQASTATLEELAKLQLTADTDIAADKDIPMVAYFREVTVSGKNTVEYEDELGVDQTFPRGNSTTWDVSLRRVAIRLSFGIDLSKAQYDAWRAYHSAEGIPPTIYVKQLQHTSYLLPGLPNDNITGNFIQQEIAISNDPTPPTPGKLIVNSDGSAMIFVDRLILPEHLLAAPNNDATAKGKAIRASLIFNDGGQVAEKEILVHAPLPATSATGYSVPRNHWVWVTANLQNEVNSVVRVIPWGGADLDPVEVSQYNLATERSAFLMPGEASSDRMEVFTDHPDGWALDLSSGGAPPTWITSVSPDAGAGDATTLVTISVAENDTNAIRTDTVWLRAGNTRKYILVRQLPTSFSITDTYQPETVPMMYVGAFWRASQYGERLIRTPRPTTGTQTDRAIIDGAWMACVMEGEEWIFLDTQPSDDPGVWTSSAILANATGFDENHRVGGYETTVSGEVSASTPGGIYFRIGLNGAYTPTPDKPARYGMILLAYTQNGQPALHRIWVRQGEGADYLMRPDGENAPGSTMSTRPHAVKWSPYNLTAPEYRDNTVARNAQAPQLTPGGGTFTEWPSQAGGMFQYSPQLGIYAHNPSITITPPITYVLEKLNWALLDQDYETCPTVDGTVFRRPSASNPYIATNQRDVNYSEIAQSLFMNVSNYNPLNYRQGLYADGYFDRLRVGGGPYVNEDGHDAAYIGSVYFNTVTNHSLFLPGSQHNGFGEGNYTSFYHSSSLSNNEKDWQLQVDRTSFSTQAYSIKNLGNIRCVDAPVIPIPGLVPTTPGMIGIRHSDLGKDPSTFSLTIMGSSTYLTDPRYKDLPFVADHLDEYADEPVYAVYFKWGSLIAMLGTQTGGVTEFSPSYVAWWPTAAQTGLNYSKPATWSWSAIKPAQPLTASNDVPAAGNRIPTFNTQYAYGDPCKLVDRATITNNSGWMTPTGGPWKSAVLIGGSNTPFGNQKGDLASEDGTPTANSIQWAAQRNRGATTSWNFDLKGAISDDGDFFLPAAGARQGDNSLSEGSIGGTGNNMAGLGTAGTYWTSSTTKNNQNNNNYPSIPFVSYGSSNTGLCLRFYSTSVSPAKDLYYSWALPIRSVPVPNQ